MSLSMKLGAGLALVMLAGVGGCMPPSARDEVVREEPLIDPQEGRPEPRGKVMAGEVETRPLPRDQLIQTLDRGPQRFIQGVEVEPVFRKGRFHGWRLVSLTNRDALVRPGDIIVTINGMQAERPEQAIALWQSLRTADEIRFVLEREGMGRVVVYRIVE